MPVCGCPNPVVCPNASGSVYASARRSFRALPPAPAFRNHRVFRDQHQGHGREPGACHIRVLAVLVGRTRCCESRSPSVLCRASTIVSHPASSCGRPLRWMPKPSCTYCTICRSSPVLTAFSATASCAASPPWSALASTGREAAPPPHTHTHTHTRARAGDARAH